MRDFVFCNTKFKLLHVIYSKIPEHIQGHIHSKNSFELHYIEKGKGTLHVHKGSYALFEGAFFVTGPDVWHRQLTDPDDPLYEYCLYFQCEEKPQEIIPQIFTDFAFYYGKQNEKLRFAFEQAAHHIGSENIFDIQEQIIYVELIINELARIYAPDVMSRENVTLDDRKYIIIEDAFLYDYAGITLSKLAAELGVSERQTQRLIAKYYGKTFVQKKTDARLEKAILMLEKNAKINEIAKAVGYADASAFEKAFKRKFGKAPKEKS